MKRNEKINFFKRKKFEAEKNLLEKCKKIQSYANDIISGVEEEEEVSNVLRPNYVASFGNQLLFDNLSSSNWIEIFNAKPPEYTQVNFESLSYFLISSNKKKIEKTGN